MNEYRAKGANCDAIERVEEIGGQSVTYHKHHKDPSCRVRTLDDEHEMHVKEAHTTTIVIERTNCMRQGAGKHKHD